ncbi:hypothetical protein B0J13DRAFT_643373 [Dactylonectria estremocensis]|uniref:Uncharacterized protein n=1 Tax=Dactylonectria estremocensis TaxID=1079267 RepID=A0A9P9FDR6_9HYPO|nr:hypothetical protein B0J13DRAFT_643373 [Dactylonectria estremocensis]
MSRSEREEEEEASAGEEMGDSPRCREVGEGWKGLSELNDGERICCGGAQGGQNEGEGGRVCRGRRNLMCGTVPWVGTKGRVEKKYPRLEGNGLEALQRAYGKGDCCAVVWTTKRCAVRWERESPGVGSLVRWGNHVEAVPREIWWSLEKFVPVYDCRQEQATGRWDSSCSSSLRSHPSNHDSNTRTDHCQRNKGLCLPAVGQPLISDSILQPVSRERRAPFSSGVHGESLQWGCSQWSWPHASQWSQWSVTLTSSTGEGHGFVKTTTCSHLTTAKPPHNSEAACGTFCPTVPVSTPATGRENVSSGLLGSAGVVSLYPSTGTFALVGATLPGHLFHGEPGNPSTLFVLSASEDTSSIDQGNLTSMHTLGATHFPSVWSSVISARRHPIPVQALTQAIPVNHTNQPGTTTGLIDRFFH